MHLEYLLAIDCHLPGHQGSRGAAGRIGDNLMPDLIFPPVVPLQAVNKIDRVQNSLESGKTSSSSKSVVRLKEACFELESLFINYLLKEMRATIPRSGFISSGKAEEICTFMLDSQLAKEMAARGGIGLSSLLCEQLGSETADDE